MPAKIERFIKNELPHWLQEDNLEDKERFREILIEADSENRIFDVPRLRELLAPSPPPPASATCWEIFSSVTKITDASKIPDAIRKWLNDLDYYLTYPGMPDAIRLAIEACDWEGEVFNISKLRENLEDCAIAEQTYLMIEVIKQIGPDKMNEARLKRAIRQKQDFYNLDGTFEEAVEGLEYDDELLVEKELLR